MIGLLLTDLLYKSTILGISTYSLSNVLTNIFEWKLIFVPFKLVKYNFRASPSNYLIW